ncbi:RNA-binding domain-containing protein [Bathymodiolus thermophilus thioautotrophic gill symbiont]|uniref:Schlafen AlbA-2 domain-containing protein n=1 Tax=Bathymodiolus thermophilus thioautotrophic gill symbiont TaxID=2360 RepID=A0A1J5UGA8_9GAMM|nr:RNA-binding domain-containing protein [Bathymodiolus thermophilus thioautotrophic gill symbiont]OIR24957.1 hypothetical protein BGC33_05035 [Bathymodiolus thermophilus thioautotrophic gill symbiont]
MFDTINELAEKIALGEDSTIEFKQALSHKTSMENEITAFANSKGGVILIGVEDSGQIIGITLEQLNKDEKTIIEICNDSIKPAVDIVTQKLTISGKNILKIEVPRSLFVHKSPQGYFIRQGSSKREMSPEQLERLMQSRSQTRIVYFDKQAVPNTRMEDLKKSLYQRFISSDNNEKLSLQKRNLLHQDGSVTVAGLLMCSQNSDTYLHNSFIQAVYYNGVEKDANYQIDAKDFKGTLDQQIINAFKFVEQYNKVSATKEIGRIDKPQYSMKAIFEAIVNAVVHRDYSKYGSKIRLFMFSDRLEIYSPGALSDTLAIDTLISNQVTRNELLASLLTKIELNDDMKVGRQYFLERRGEGVGIIMKESKQLSGKTPIYQLNGEELQLTIFPAQSLQGENDDD